MVRPPQATFRFSSGFGAMCPTRRRISSGACCAQSRPTDLPQRRYPVPCSHNQTILTKLTLTKLTLAKLTLTKLTLAKLTLAKLP